jgi:starch synthase
VVLEAMASGIPVVASDTGGVLENMRHGLNGLCVRAGDAPAFARTIAEMLANPERRAVMGQAARAFSVARDWARELDLLVPMYHAAVTARAERTSLAAAAA